MARRPLVLPAALAVLLCACGSSAHPGAQPQGGAAVSGVVAKGSPSPTGHQDVSLLHPAPSSNAGSSAAGQNGAVAQGNNVGEPQATSTPAQYAEGTRPAPATAVMSPSCVTPGSTETLHLSAPPSDRVAYDAQYSDGQDGSKYGGIGQGQLDGSGQFTTTWLVAPTAPAGKVIVWIAVSGGDASAFRQPEFVVASHC